MNKRLKELVFDCADEFFRSAIESHCLCYSIDNEVFDMNHVDPFGRPDVDRALEYFSLRDYTIPYFVDIRKTNPKDMGTISFRDKEVGDEVYSIETPLRIYVKDHCVSIDELRNLGVNDQFIEKMECAQKLWDTLANDDCPHPSQKIIVEIRNDLNDLKLKNAFFVTSYEN